MYRVHPSVACVGSRNHCAPQTPRTASASATAYMSASLRISSEPPTSCPHVSHSPLHTAHTPRVWRRLRVRPLPLMSPYHDVARPRG
eukprot:3192918-Prymnesium_polylepis.2